MHKVDHIAFAKNDPVWIDGKYPATVQYCRDNVVFLRTLSGSVLWTRIGRISHRQVITFNGTQSALFS